MGDSIHFSYTLIAEIGHIQVTRSIETYAHGTVQLGLQCIPSVTRESRVAGARDRRNDHLATDGVAEKQYGGD